MSIQVFKVLYKWWKSNSICKMCMYLSETSIS